MGLKKKQKCSHLVHRSKYERNAPEIGNWWHKLFSRLEADASIPPDKKVEVLNEIFPSKLLNRILSILSVAQNDGRLQLEQHAGKTDLRETCDALPESISQIADEKNRREIGPDNLYAKFFRQRPDRAAIWHTLPPLSLEEMNLTQKAEAITETIATDFVAWMINISDEDAPTALTVKSVLKMFQIGFDNHAARSLQVRLKEMASVPDGVAILKDLPEMAKRSQLHRQLKRDLNASRQKKKVFAFGTKLSPELQVHPPKEEDVMKWLVCKRIPTRLQTMAAVWQGITHLRSTRAYCDYLMEHPKVTPPKYLVDMHMLDPTMRVRGNSFEMDRAPIQEELDKSEDFMLESEI